MTETVDFQEIGRQAYLNGESAAPIANPTVQAAIADLPVGGGAAKIMREFAKGWHTANLAALVEQ